MFDGISFIFLKRDRDMREQRMIKRQKTEKSLKVYYKISRYRIRIVMKNNGRKTYKMWNPGYQFEINNILINIDSF